MTNDPQGIWQRLSAEYLKRVAKALERTGHPRRGEVVEDVKAHLDRLYEKLSVAERTPQRMEAIIQDMGEPAEYAEVLAPDDFEAPTLRSLWRRRGVRVGAGLVLAAVAAVAALIWPLQALAVLSMVLYAAVLVAVVVGYVRTRNSGFVWLGVAIVVWPLAWSLLTRTVIRPEIDQLSMGRPARIFPFTLVERGRMTLGMLVMVQAYVARIGRYALILIAVVKLAAWRRESQRPT